MSQSAERDDRPRVLFVIGGLERGGSESQLVALVEQIHPDRAEALVATVTRADDRTLEDRLLAGGVRVAVLGGSGSRAVRRVRAAAGFARLIRSFRPDVTYAWLEEAALLATPIARTFGIPCLIARRNISGPYAGRHPLVRRAIHRAERLGVLATANSEAVADETARRGWPRERIRLVPNGHPDAGPLPFPADDRIELGCLARFRAEKGHMRLLAAVARLDTATPWRLTLGGDGPLMERVRAEADRLGIADRVRLPGLIADAREFWAGQHVALLLSDHEGSPNALIEAAMAGRPLVGTRVGGIPAIVEPDAGFVLAPDNLAGIADAIGELVDDASLRERMGAAARARALKAFSIDALVEGHMAAIEAVRGNGPLVAS